MAIFGKSVNFNDQDGAEITDLLNQWYTTAQRQANAQKLDEVAGAVNRIPFYGSDQSIADIQAQMIASAVMLVAKEEADGTTDIWIVTKSKAFALNKVLGTGKLASINNVPGDLQDNLSLTVGAGMAIQNTPATSSIAINIDDFAQEINAKLGTKIETVVANAPLTAVKSGTQVTLSLNGGVVNALNGIDGAVTLVGGQNVSISPNTSGKTITIASTGGSGGTATKIKDPSGGEAIPDVNSAITFKTPNNDIEITASGNDVNFSLAASPAPAADEPFTVWYDDTYTGGGSNGSADKPYTTLSNAIASAEGKAVASLNNEDRWNVKAKGTASRTITENITLGTAIWGINLILPYNYYQGQITINMAPTTALTSVASNLDLDIYYFQGTIKFSNLATVSTIDQKQDKATLNMSIEKLFPSFLDNTASFFVFDTQESQQAGFALSDLDIILTVKDFVEPQPQAGGAVATAIKVIGTTSETNYQAFTITFDINIDSIDKRNTQNGAITQKAPLLTYVASTSAQNTMTCVADKIIVPSSTAYNYNDSGDTKGAIISGGGIAVQSIDVDTLNSKTSTLTSADVTDSLTVPSKTTNANTGALYRDSVTDELKVRLLSGVQEIALKSDLPAVSSASIVRFKNFDNVFESRRSERELLLGAFKAVDETDLASQHPDYIHSSAQVKFNLRSKIISSAQGDLVAQTPWEGTDFSETPWASWSDALFDSGAGIVVAVDNSDATLLRHSLTITYGTGANNKKQADYQANIIPGNTISVLNTAQSGAPINAANRKRFEMIVTAITTNAATCVITGYSNIGHAQTVDANFRPFATVAEVNAITAANTAIRLGSQFYFEFAKGEAAGSSAPAREHVMPQAYIVVYQSRSIPARIAYTVHSFSCRHAYPFANDDTGKAKNGQFGLPKIAPFIKQDLVNRLNLSGTDDLMISILPYVLFVGVANNTADNTNEEYNYCLPFEYDGYKMKLRIAPIAAGDPLTTSSYRRFNFSNLLSGKWGSWVLSGNLVVNSGYIAGMLAGSNFNISKIIIGARTSPANNGQSMGVSLGGQEIYSLAEGFVQFYLSIPRNEFMNCHNLVKTAITIEPTVANMLYDSSTNADSLSVLELEVNSLNYEEKITIEKSINIIPPAPSMPALMSLNQNTPTASNIVILN